MSLLRQIVESKLPVMPPSSGEGELPEHKSRFIRNPVTGSYEHRSKAPIDEKIKEIRNAGNTDLSAFTNDTSEEAQEKERLRKKKEDEKQRQLLMRELKAMEKERKQRLSAMNKDTVNLLTMASKLTDVLNRLRGLFK